jgi:hypothetical protein
VSSDNSLTHGRIPTGELNLIEAMTRAEEFWERVLQADQATGYNPPESEPAPASRGPLLAWPPLWRFPWEPSETPGRPGA